MCDASRPQYRLAARGIHESIIYVYYYILRLYYLPLDGRMGLAKARGHT